MAAAAKFELVISSRFENLDLVDVLMQAFAGHLGLEDQDAAETALAVREAAINAMRHTGGEDDERTVRISAAVDGDQLRVEIADDGPGFDPSTVGDPLAPENILKPRGRGIFLMRSYMDEVSFRFPELGGTVVELRRGLLPPAAAPGSRN